MTKAGPNEWAVLLPEARLKLKDSEGVLTKFRTSNTGNCSNVVRRQNYAQIMSAVHVR